MKKNLKFFLENTIKFLKILEIILSFIFVQEISALIDVFFPLVELILIVKALAEPPMTVSSSAHPTPPRGWGHVPSPCFYPCYAPECILLYCIQYTEYRIL